MSPNSLEVPSSARCAFCDYLSHRRPYTILWRSQTVAFLITREQRGNPHVLVLPVQHRPTLLDLDAREANAVMAGVIEAAHTIDAAEKRQGIAVWQNNGISANQTIPHVHFHVAGTLDEGGTRWGKVPEVSIEDTDRIADGLRPYLRPDALKRMA